MSAPKPLHAQMLPSDLFPVRGEVAASHRLEDLPTLRAHLEDSELRHAQCDAALQDAIHALVRQLQSKLTASTSRYSRLERRYDAAVAEVQQLRQACSVSDASREASQRELDRIRRSEAAAADDVAESQSRVTAREALAREQLQWVATREAELNQQEIALSQRIASFEMSLGLRQSHVDAEAARVQQMAAHAQQLLDSATKDAESSTSRRMEVERARRVLDESITVQISELQHRQRLMTEALSEREAYVEQRLHACAALEVRLRQWASDINTEAAGQARVRHEELATREAALQTLARHADVRERELTEARKVLDADRHELSQIFQQILDGATGLDMERLRPLQRLRRVSTMVHANESAGTTANASSIDSSSWAHQAGASPAHNLNGQSQARAHQGGSGVMARTSSLQGEFHPGAAATQGGSAHNASVASSAFAVSRASSDGRRTPTTIEGAPPAAVDPRFLRHEDLRDRQPPPSTFRIPGNTSTWSWGTSDLYQSRSTSVVDSVEGTRGQHHHGQHQQYFTEGSQRLQRSPPERRVITSPLKLKEGKGSLQDPLP